jgi:hypothetical protein
MGTLSPSFTKEIFPPLRQLKSWGRSMLMRCTCIKKDLALNASQSRKGKAKASHDDSSDGEIDDLSLALMVKKTTKMMKKLNKNGIKFEGKKKKIFTSSKRKPIFEME